MRNSRCYLTGWKDRMITAKKSASQAEWQKMGPVIQKTVRHTDRYPDGTHRSTEGMDPRNRVITGFSSLYITLSTKKQTAVFFSVVCFFIISSLFFCTKRAFSFCFMICAHITYLFSRISQTHIPDQSMSVLHSPL